MSAVVTAMDVIGQARADSVREHTRMMLVGREAVYRASLPRLVTDARLSRFHARNAADASVLKCAREWVEACVAGSGDHLTLTGPNGTGKSWLIAAIGWMLLPTARPAVYVSASDLWEELRHSYGSKDGQGETEKAILSRYVGAPVLLLDEVGGGNLTEAYRAAIASLICKRANQGLPIVVATNLAPHLLAEATDSRAADRLAAGKVIPVLGKSRRGAA